jgi:multidrug efflux system membrane fusion protein
MNMPMIFDAPVLQPAAPAHGVVRRHWRLSLLALVAMSALGWKLLDRPPPPPAPPVATVAVATPILRDVNQWDEYIGRFAPSKTVEVRPRVSGAVTAIHFRDGEIVRRGALLFTIDQRPYSAALAEAQANVASARSAVALAASDYDRAHRLTGDEAIAASETDALRAKLQSAQAALAAAQARARERALDLEFTQVRAPIAGRISDRRIDVGNLVSGENGAGATLLTTINALDPIYFEFDASEALFLKAQRARAARAGAPIVEVRLQDEPDYHWQGHLDFTDNGLDSRSDTIRVRAVLNNPQMFLTPGLFGNMRLASGGTVRAMLVPDAAVQTEQARKTVLVVAGDGSVMAKPVELGPVIGGLRVIRGGLTGNDQVVVGNLQAAMPGAKVKVRQGQIVATAPSISSPAASPPVAAQATFAR